jgi:hypothetical protein
MKRLEAVFFWVNLATWQKNQNKKKEENFVIIRDFSLYF